MMNNECSPEPTDRMSVLRFGTTNPTEMFKFLTYTPFHKATQQEIESTTQLYNIAYKDIMILLTKMYDDQRELARISKRDNPYNITYQEAEADLLSLLLSFFSSVKMEVEK